MPVGRDLAPLALRMRAATHYLGVLPDSAAEGWAGCRRCRRIRRPQRRGWAASVLRPADRRRVRTRLSVAFPGP